MDRFIKRDGQVPFRAPQSMGGHALQNLPTTPTSPNDAASKAYVDAHGGNFTAGPGIIIDTGTNTISVDDTRVPLFTSIDPGFWPSTLTGSNNPTGFLRGDGTWVVLLTGGDIKSDGTVPFAANESMGGFKLIDVGTPSLGTDAANKTYVDTQEALDLRLDGTRLMTGALNMNTHLINNVVNPVSPQDAATKSYTDTQDTAILAAAKNFSNSNIGAFLTLVNEDGEDGAPGPQGPQGTSGALAVGFQYKADTGSIVNSDPGTADMRWNNVTQTLATELYVDDIDDAGTDLSVFFSILVPGDRLRIQSQDNANQFQEWLLISITDQIGYFKFVVSLLSATGGDFSNRERIVLVFLRSGPTGPTGPTGPQGPTGSIGLDGESGEDGLPGVPGRDGTNGIPGSTGPAGADGESGEDGLPGTPGRDGIAGPMGPIGPAGEDGINTEWVFGVQSFDSLSPLTTKGDLIGFNGANNIRFGVGTNTQILTADTTSPSGFSWQDVTSVGGGEKPSTVVYRATHFV